MTKKEQQAFDRIKIENAEMRKTIDRQMEIYRDQLWELIDLRAQVELIRSAVQGDVL